VLYLGSIVPKSISSHVPIYSTQHSTTATAAWLSCRLLHDNNRSVLSFQQAGVCTQQSQANKPSYQTTQAAVVRTGTAQYSAVEEGDDSVLVVSSRCVSCICSQVAKVMKLQHAGVPSAGTRPHGAVHPAPSCTLQKAAHLLYRAPFALCQLKLIKVSTCGQRHSAFFCSLPSAYLLAASCPASFCCSVDGTACSTCLRSGKGNQQPGHKQCCHTQGLCCSRNAAAAVALLPSSLHLHSLRHIALGSESAAAC